MTVVARLEAILHANTADFDRAMNQSESKMHKLGKVAGTAGLAIAAGVAYGLEKSVKAAIEAQKSEARLTQAYKNAHVAIAPLRGQIEGLEASSRKLGFTDEQTTTAIGSLITATHNQKLANKDLAVAQDLARFKGVSLQDATKMLTMAMTGSQRAAKQLGITVPTVTTTYDALKATMGKTIDAHEKMLLAQAKLHDKQLTGIAVVDAVRDHVKGQAKAYSDTAAGAMEQFHAQLQHIEVEIGNKLLPVMMMAIKWITTNWPAISAVIKRVWQTDIQPTLAAMIELVKAVVTAIRDHWNTIGPIVIGVGKVLESTLKVMADVIRVFAALLRGDWSGAWKAAKQTVSDALDAIKARIQLALSVGSAILDAMSALGKAMLRGLAAGITAGLGDVKDAVTSLFHKVIGWAKSALGIASPSAVFHDIGQNAIKGFINGVGSMAGALKHAVVGIAKHAASSIVHAAGGVIPKFGIEGKSLPGEHASGSAQKYLIPWANQEGIAVTSVDTGTHVSGSYHYQDRAIDVAGSSGAMRKFFLDSIKHFGVGNITELFYDPMGYYVKNGATQFGAIGGHSDHVHIALDQGGWLPTGTNLITNNTGRPERVISGNGDNIVIPVSIGGEHVATVIFDQLRRKAKVFEKGNGRPAWGI